MAYIILVKRFFYLLFFGILFLGKTFAYLNIGGLYITELFILFSFPLVLAKLKNANSILLLFVFCSLSISLGHLIMSLLEYGLNVKSFRDYAAVYYIYFAVFGFLFVQFRASLIEKVIKLYSLWITFVWFVVKLFNVTGADERIYIIHLKSGDIAVISTFVLLYMVYSRKFKAKWFLLLSVNLILWTLSSRAGMLSIFLATAFAMTIYFKRTKRALNFFKYGTLVVVFSTIFFSLVPRVKFSKHYEISPQQLLINVTSIFGESEGKFEGTKQWRLMWWERIIEDATNDGHYLMGNGYGTDITFGMTSAEMGNTRSPHNYYMTILARSGILFAVLFTSFIILSLGVAVAKNLPKREIDLHTIVSATFLAALVNSCFDIYCENPMGAIVYWSLFGLMFRRNITLHTKNAFGANSRVKPLNRTSSFHLPSHAN